MAPAARRAETVDDRGGGVLIGRVFDDRYEILRKLGTGGMAEVYLAHDRHLDRDVALKVLLSKYAEDEQFIERFRREASAAASSEPPQHRADLRSGRRRGHVLHRHGVPGRAPAEGDHPPLRPACARTTWSPCPARSWKRFASPTART